MNQKEYIDKAIESIDNRLLDKGFNICGDWLGYYDEYALYFVPRKHVNWYGEEETSEWGTLEIHTKTKVFNPYKYCGGDGYEYEKIGEFSILENQWKDVRTYLYRNNYMINDKKVCCFDNPYPEPRVEFYQGSDVPINGRYE